MMPRFLVLICALCFSVSAFAYNSPKHIIAVVVEDSGKAVTCSSKKTGKGLSSHSRMSKSTRNRIAQIEALSKKIDKIEANIKRRETEIAKVEASQ